VKVETGGVQRFPNLTPFIFHTETFTGKFICFFKLEWRNLFRNDFVQLTTFFMPARGSDIPPHMGRDILLIGTRL